MMAAPRPLAAVLLLLCLWLRLSSPLPSCPESCTCQRATLVNCSASGLSLPPPHIQDSVAELDLSHNLLSAVALYRPLPNLRRVWLGNNTITRLSLCTERANEGQHVRGGLRRRSRPRSTQECLSWAPTLQVLSVERNQLVQVPQGLETSESLQILQLSFNRISALHPADLSRLRQLKELHVQHNFITALHSQTFQGLHQLTVLDLSYNLLTSLHPVMYLSLHNIGADVRLRGNRWRCDCTMRSLRRWLVYESSRGLQAWNLVCASPVTLSGRDLLQVEEGDFNCSNAENGPELYRDVTVSMDSDILLSCSMEDSVWWTPSGQASGNQPQGGLLISKTTERDTGLYVCVSQLEQRVISIFNLQIRNMETTKRKTRSLSRTDQQVIPQDTLNRMDQGRNQIATQSNLALAVVLSVLITFLVAFVLGVLTRPFIEVLWRRVFNKRSSSTTNSVSTAEQRQYDNEAYHSGEELEEGETHRERRVTFSNVDFREQNTVPYYDTEAGGNQEDTNNRTRKKRNKTKAKYRPENDEPIAGAAGTNDHKDRDLSHVNDVGHIRTIEFEHIPDPGEVMEKISLSSQSDSSPSDKTQKKEQVVYRDHSALMTSQVEENPAQTGVFPKAVPPLSLHDNSKTHGFAHEPFGDWSPHKNIKPGESDLSQENGEQFEFSDSVRSGSERSSVLFGSYNDSKQIIVFPSEKRKDSDMSSYSSYISDDEPTHYTVNPESLDDGDIKIQKSLQRHHQSDYRHEAPSPPSNSSASSENEEETRVYIKKMEQKVVGTVKSPLEDRQTASHDPEIRWPTLNFGHVTPVKRRLDIKAPSTASPSSDDSKKESIKKQEQTDVGMAKVTFKAPYLPSDSSSSSDSEEEMDYIKKQQMEVGLTKSPFRDQTASPDPEIRWPTIDLGRITLVKRRLDIKALSPPVDSSSSSDTEEETMKKQEQKQVGMARFPFKVTPPSNSSSSSDGEAQTTDYKKKWQQMEVGVTKSPLRQYQTAHHNPEIRWPVLDIGHITRIKRHLDIKVASPTVDSSSSSDSEQEPADYIKKHEQQEAKKFPLNKSSSYNHETETRWPTIDLGHITPLKRRLDIKVASAPVDSSSSSDSEQEPTDYIKKHKEKEVEVKTFPLKSPHYHHETETRWPTIDLGHITPLKQRLDIKVASAPVDSSSSSDSEQEPTDYIKKYKQKEVEVKTFPLKSPHYHHETQTRWPTIDLGHITPIQRRLDIKVASAPVDSSSSSDSEQEPTDYIKKYQQKEVEVKTFPLKSPSYKYETETRWPTIDLDHITPIKRRLDIKAPSVPVDSSSSSDSEQEPTDYIKKYEQKEVEVKTFPLKSPHYHHETQTRWPTIDLGHITPLKQRLDIKAPSAPVDSSSSSDSEQEPTDYIKKYEQKEVEVKTFPLKSPSYKYETETRWPTIDLDHITPIKRRLDIKAPSVPVDSSSSSDSEQEPTDYIKKHKEKEVEVKTFPLKSPHYHHETQTRWPTIDLGHITPLKQRLDIKAPSAPVDSSSSSDSEQEPTDYIKKYEQKEVEVKTFPLKSPSYKYETETRWPTIDLDHITPIKRRLDIKAPSVPVDSSSSSDSEQEPTEYIKKHKEKEVEVKTFPLKSPHYHHETQTRWPTIDLGHITPLKQRLDIKAPSAPVDSSSSSDSEQEPTDYIKKYEQKEVEVKTFPLKSPSYKYETETRWPTIDLGHITPLKQRLDIKVASAPVDSSSSSDSEQEPTDYIKKYEQKEVEVKTFPLKSPSYKYETETRWPTIDLGHITPIKRRLDIKAPSAPVDSSSSSDSEQEPTDYIKKYEQKEVEVKTFPLKSPHYHHETETRWPTIDLGHITPLKQRLDIKVASAPVDSSSSSDSEQEPTDYIKKYEQKEVEVKTFPLKSPSYKYETETRWPTIDLAHITPIQRRLDIKAPSAPVDSSSSSDSEQEPTDYIKKYKQKEVEVKTFPLKSPSYKYETETRWPTIDLAHITPIQRRLDIKAPSAPVDSSSSSDSEQEPTDYIKKHKEKEVEAEKFQLKPPSYKYETETRWPTIDLDHITPIKRRLDNKIPSPSSYSSSSSDSEQETKKMQREVGLTKLTFKESETGSSFPETRWPALDRITPASPETKTSAESINPVPLVNPELQSRWAMMNLGFSRFKKRPEMTTHASPDVPSSIPADSPGSFSGKSENIHERSRQKRWRVGKQGIKNVESSLTPKDRLVISKEAEDKFSSRQSSDSSSSSENEDGSVGKAQLPSVTDKGVLTQTSMEQTQSQTKAVEMKVKVELKSQTSKADESQSVWPQSFTNVPYIKKTLDTKAISQRVSSFYSNEYDIVDHTVPVKTDVSNTGFTSCETANSAKAEKEGSSHGVRDVNVSTMTFDDVVKGRIGQSRESLDVGKQPEIRWTGVGHHLSDLSLSSQSRYMDGNHLTLHQSPPAGSEHHPHHSSSSSSDSEEKQATADASRMHKYSFLTADKAIYKFSNLSSSTSEVVSRDVIEDRREKKGLSALKAMSSERQKWDREDEDLGKGASPEYDNQDSTIQGATTFNHLSSGKDIKTLTKQSQPDSLLHSSSGDDKKALELLYHIPQYRTHVFRATPPPPPPATPPPHEAPGLPWRSHHSFNKQEWRSVTSYLQQRGESAQSSQNQTTSTTSDVSPRSHYMSNA